MSQCPKQSQNIPKQNWNFNLWFQDFSRLSLPDPSPVSGYFACICACRRAGAWEQALELLNDAWAKEVEPNVECYSHVIRACRAEARDQSDRLLRELRNWGAAPTATGQLPSAGVLFSAWWFGTSYFFLFHMLIMYDYVGNFIIPIDFHSFQRGRVQPPTRDFF